VVRRRLPHRRCCRNAWPRVDPLRARPGGAWTWASSVGGAVWDGSPASRGAVGAEDPRPLSFAIAPSSRRALRL